MLALMGPQRGTIQPSRAPIPYPLSPNKRTRLLRERNLDLVQTAPNVTYEILKRKGEILTIDSPQKMPDAGQKEAFLAVLESDQ
jgi:hypothetical protein